MSPAGDKAPPTNKGKTMIWTASAMMASAIAARKREPGEIVTESSITAAYSFHIYAWFAYFSRCCCTSLML